MTWQNKIIGQKEALQTVYKTIVEGKFPHATLISGKPGYGTLPLAMNIIKALCCTNFSAEGPCNECSACRRIDTLQYPDLHMAFPVTTLDGKIRAATTSEDFMIQWREQLLSEPYFDLESWTIKISRTSSNPDINAAEVQRILQQLSLQAFSGEVKIQLIWMAHLVGDQSNKLLKIIEEPPAYTFFILVTIDADSILPTILSRCQHIRVYPIEGSELRSYLEDLHGLTPNNAAHIANFTGGDYLESLVMIASDHEEDLRSIISWWEYCANYDLVNIINWSNEFSALSKVYKINLLRYAIKLLKGIVHLKTLGSSQKILSNQELQAIRKAGLVDRLELDQIAQLHDIKASLITGINRNLHDKMQIFNSCLLIESLLNSRVKYPI